MRPKLTLSYIQVSLMTIRKKKIYRKDVDQYVHKIQVVKMKT